MEACVHKHSTWINMLSTWTLPKKHCFSVLGVYKEVPKYSNAYIRQSIHLHEMCPCFKDLFLISTWGGQAPTSRLTHAWFDEPIVFAFRLEYSCICQMNELGYTYLIDYRLFVLSVVLVRSCELTLLGLVISVKQNVLSKIKL